MGAIDVVKQHGWKVVGAAVVSAAFVMQWGHMGGLMSAGQTTALAAESPATHAIHAEGRLMACPGAEVVVGTDIGGTIRLLPVLEKARVKKGDVLAEIDASEQKAALAEARARVAEAEVDIHYFDVELARSQKLFASSAVASNAVDESLHARDAAKARRDSAAATASRLSTVVNKTRIVSPIDGVVLERFVEVGEAVGGGTRLVTVADLNRTRIEAEIDEYDVGRIALGQDVTVSAEGYANQAWPAKVEEIPDTVTSRRIKPEDPGRPSDTRVLLVKVVPVNPLPVKLGQRVEIEIKTAR